MTCWCIEPDCIDTVSGAMLKPLPAHLGYQVVNRVFWPEVVHKNRYVELVCYEALILALASSWSRIA